MCCAHFNLLRHPYPVYSIFRGSVRIESRIVYRFIHSLGVWNSSFDEAGSKAISLSLSLWGQKEEEEHNRIKQQIAISNRLDGSSEARPRLFSLSSHRHQSWPADDRPPQLTTMRHVDCRRCGSSRSRVFISLVHPFMCMRTFVFVSCVRSACVFNERIEE